MIGFGIDTMHPVSSARGALPVALTSLAGLAGASAAFDFSGAETAALAFSTAFSDGAAQVAAGPGTPVALAVGVEAPAFRGLIEGANADFAAGTDGWLLDGIGAQAADGSLGAASGTATFARGADAGGNCAFLYRTDWALAPGALYEISIGHGALSGKLHVGHAGLGGPSTGVSYLGGLTLSAPGTRVIALRNTAAAPRLLSLWLDPNRSIDLGFIRAREVSGSQALQSGGAAQPQLWQDAGEPLRLRFGDSGKLLSVQLAAGASHLLLAAAPASALVPVAVAPGEALTIGGAWDTLAPGLAATLSAGAGPVDLTGAVAFESAPSPAAVNAVMALMEARGAGPLG